jgi:hypothetical protein
MKFENIESLYATLASFKDKEMPIRLSYKFTLILDKIEREYNFFSKEMRKIINKYGMKDEHDNLIQEDGNIKINPDSFSLAEKSIQELYETEFKTPDVTFTLKELETINIKPSDLQSLLPFIETDDDDELEEDEED